MAYREADELLLTLPGNGRGLDESEAELQIARWKARLEFTPATAREQTLAETIVDVGAGGTLLQLQARKDGLLQTPSADAMVAQALAALAEYNNMRYTPGEESTSGGTAFLKEVPWA